MFKQAIQNALAWGLSFFDQPMDSQKLADYNFAQHEVWAINDCYRHLGIDAYVDLDNTIICPRGNYIRYRITGPGLKINTIESYRKDLAQAINDYRRNAVQGAPLVTVNWTGSATFDIAYPFKVPPVNWSDRPSHINGLKAWELSLGLDFSNGTERHITLDYTDESLSHILVTGSSGSGKTIMLINMIESLCRSTSPADCQVIVLDTKHGASIKPLAKLPHVTLYNEVGDCVDAVKAVQLELERRKRKGHGGKKLFLVLEEMADLMLAHDDPDALWLPLTRLSQTGRELGIFLWCCTQYAHTDIINPTFRFNLKTRIGGAVTTQDESRVSTGRTDVPCHNLPGKGSFYLVHNMDVVRIQCALLKGEELATAQADTIRKWQGVTPYQIPVACAQNVAEANTEAILTSVEPMVGDGLEDDTSQIDGYLEQVPDLVERYGREIVTGWLKTWLEGTLTVNTIRKATKLNSERARPLFEQIIALSQGGTDFVDAPLSSGEEQVWAGV